jgi:hypothetical protein
MKRVLVVSSLVSLTSCGTPLPSWVPDAGPCAAYVSTADLLTPATSFMNDVMPVFESNCASASCHGIAQSPQGGLFLGAELAQGSDAKTVYSQLVNTASVELPTMAFVTPAQPEKSYLMHKLDDDQCLFESSCVEANCMQPMPDNAMQLDPTTRDIVRRWIAQGADDN